jgi:hypothetical protein
MLGAGAAFSTVLTAYRYTNGLRGVGDIRDQVDDDGEVERRAELKKVRRRPLSETLQQLGEGRGMSRYRNYMQVWAHYDRHLRTRLRGEEAATTDGQVRCRREGSPGVSLDAITHFLWSLQQQIPHREGWAVPGLCIYYCARSNGSSGYQLKALFYTDVECCTSSRKTKLVWSSGSYSLSTARTCDKAFT